MKCKAGDVVKIRNKRFSAYSISYSGIAKDDIFTVHSKYKHPIYPDFWACTSQGKRGMFTIRACDLEPAAGNQPPPKRPLGYEVSL